VITLLACGPEASAGFSPLTSLIWLDASDECGKFVPPRVPPRSASSSRSVTRSGELRGRGKRYFIGMHRWISRYDPGLHEEKYKVRALGADLTQKSKETQSDVTTS